MTGVIEARAKQTGVSYEAMEQTYLERVSLRRMVTARRRRGHGRLFAVAGGAQHLRPVARRRRQCRDALTDRSESMMASNNKVIITCAVTGAIHTPSMSPYLPVTAEEIADAAIGAAEAGAAIVHLARARRARPAARPDPRGLRALPAAHQAGDQGRDQSDHRRRALHDGAGAREAGRDVQAGSRLAQHGLDEFRAVSDAEPLQDLQARLGGAGARELARSRVPQHLQGHRIRAAHARRLRHALRVRMLRHLRISTISRISSSAASSSRRCSCRRCSASSAASARIPRTSCT